jgi:copper homeostasis protein
MPLFEVCIDSVPSAIAAEIGGAHRVELCDNLMEGGTTPSLGAIEICRERVAIDIMVMIRPRGGDFLYSEVEFEIMKRDIQRLISTGVTGVVFGILLPNGQIDRARMQTLIDLARPLQVTCHRAFDMTPDPEQALEDLVALGVDRVLTSGQEPAAPEGADLIARLIRQAGDRIVVMPGAGLTPENIAPFLRQTHATEYHATAWGRVPSAMQFQNPRVYMGVPGSVEYEQTITSAEEVTRMVRAAANVL